MEFKSKDLIKSNIEVIESLFPECITEQKGKKVVDFEKLKLQFTDEVADDVKEKYQLTWPGKRQAITESNKRTTKTLIPLKEKSVDFENTKNIYIEGDNLEVLKILQESYLNKIKCIYIDPPYNTGNDLIYKDNFTVRTDDELQNSGQIDELGNKLMANPESYGRYHSDWLSMMYPRLKLARNLLKDDGVIFISIDDNEYDNLKKICDEIFGENNFISSVCRIRKKGSNQGNFFRPTKDYILIYSKNIENTQPFFLKNEIEVSKFKLSDEGGIFKKGHSLFQNSLDPLRGCKNQRYYIECPDGSFIIPPGSIFPKVIGDAEKVAPVNFEDKVWRWSYKSYLEKKHLLFFDVSKKSPLLNEKGLKSKWNIYTKDYYEERKTSESLPNDVIYDCINSIATTELKKLNINFDYAKPTKLINYLFEIQSLNNGIILDFFSGSGTICDSTIQYNAYKNKNLQYIAVCLKENISSTKTTDGLNYITDLAQERIKRAGAKIKEETGADIDYGFRVFKVGDSTLNDVFYTADEVTQIKLLEMEGKFKKGVCKDDILTHILLDLGYTLDVKISDLGNGNYVIEDDLLFVCLVDEFTDETYNLIKDIQPSRLVLDEKSFDNDSKLINVMENFKNDCEHTSVSLI